MISIHTFSPYPSSGIQFLNPKSSSIAFPSSIKVHQSQKALPFPPTHKPSHPFPKPSYSQTPFSILGTNSPTSSEKNNLPKLLWEKCGPFLVGSFICIGCFNGFCNRAAAISLPAQTSEKLEREGRKSEEEEMYEKMLERDLRDVKGLKVLVHEKMRRGKSGEAVKYVERLIELEPEEVEWRLLLALCYEAMGQLSRAKRLFKEILVERPLLLRALHGLALAMHKNHEGSAVFEMLNQALEIARREKRVTEGRDIRILIAQMHVVKGDLEEGLKRFQDLVDEDPRDFRPYLCQGIIYSLLDKKDQAAEQFETYQSLVPHEFPQRGFIDDVVLAAKSTSQKQFRKKFGAEYSDRK